MLCKAYCHYPLIKISIKNTRNRGVKKIVFYNGKGNIVITTSFKDYNDILKKVRDKKEKVSGYLEEKETRFIEKASFHLSFS